MAYMKHNLLKEIEIGSKNALVKKRIITHYIYNGSSTITDLSKEMDLSVPTVTKFIDEMCEDGYINDYGKLETSGGRHPNLYGLNPESGYFIGVDIKKFAINIGLINFKGDMMELKMNIPYTFENSKEGWIGFYKKNDMNLSGVSCNFYDNEYRILYAGEFMDDEEVYNRTHSVYLDFMGEELDSRCVFH